MRQGRMRFVGDGALDVPFFIALRPPHPSPAAVPLFARRETAPFLSPAVTFSPAIGGNRPRGEGFLSCTQKTTAEEILGGGFLFYW